MTELRLLVYGLLREGHSLSNLMAGAERLGACRVPGFDLFDLGDYPGATPGSGELIGELYRLPSAASFEALDEAEGVQDEPPLYRRQLVSLTPAELGEPQQAWLYVYARPLGDAPRIPTGDWVDRKRP